MTEAEETEIVKKRLGKRSIVLVGLMGCGKSSVGKRLALKLGLPFVDADDEIERAAAKTINEIFADHGEAQFRDGERKVIARLLRNGPQVLATGGGAYMHPETRQAVRENGVSVWLRAELPVLMRRVMKRDTRPLLRDGNPEATMRRLIEARYPVYAEADMTVESREEPHDIIVTEILNRLAGPSTVRGKGVRSIAPSRSVRVELDERSYDVLIGGGLVRDAGTLIKARLGKVKCGVVTDENVARHHLAALEDSLKAEGLFAGSIVMKPGEATKSFRDLTMLSERLLELGLERGDLVVPFGGGVIGDLAGFAAGILRRGVRFVQIPTSLLAQVDSSVGGKTGINTPQGKNLIGVFHQPSLVIADTSVLTTLPPRQMRSGYAEVAKYGLLGDAPFFSWLEDNWRAIFGNNGPEVTKAIETSVAAKAAIVARDEMEMGDRALLNLGHTFGHALEAWTGYSDRLFHGEGVAIGMCMAFRLSEHLGICPRGRATRVAKHLKAVGLPTKISDIAGGRADAGELLRLMAQDKKVRAGKATFILVRDIGQAFVSRDVTPETVKAFLGREIGL
jgi:shikimate kinase/3-dehydroquinate synthase